MKIPQYICTREEYPNIHKDHEGRAMPEALGLCSLVAADSHTPGAIEAILVDKPAKKYLCARGSLKGIDQVYANGKIKSSGWAVSYADGGRTYITFTNFQGAKRITFNCRGYMYSAWNSANGYVQNPAYVLLFYLAFFLGVAEEDLNIQSFVDMADYFVTQGWEEAGKFIAQEQNESNASLQELLVSFGIRYWTANDGRITIGRRDVSTYGSAQRIWGQLDVLERPEKPMNWDEAINYLTYIWDNFPCSNVMTGSGTVLNQDSIDFLGEKRSELAFSWTTDENMALALAQEELFRLAYGNPKQNHKVPFFWLDRVDIGDVVAIQDLFGVKTVATAARGYRKRIDIQTDYLDANLTDFPLYVRINNDPDIGARCRPDGFDIRFYASDGVTELPYERESFAVAGGLASGDFWVKTNLAMAGTHIYIYYGNLDAADGQNAEAVWDSDFKAVYHMKDATTSTILDSTSNNADGTKKAANEPIEAGGKIGKGQDFAGDDDYIHSTPAINGLTQITLEAWIDIDTLVFQSVISVGTIGAGMWRMEITDGGALRADFWADGNAVSDDYLITTIGGWYHICVTFDGTTKLAYLNGTQVATATSGATPVSGSHAHFGALWSVTYFFDGLMDEPRISSIARTAAWIKFEYHNMAEADNELTWWMEESAVTEFGEEAWHYFLINSISPDFKGYNIGLDLEDAAYLMAMYDDENQPLLDDDGSILIGE